MKNKLTRKLMLSAFTLLFAVISLGASTYAWFTMNTTATVDVFEGQVIGGSGFDIAVTTKGYKTAENNEFDKITWYSGVLPSSAIMTVIENSSFEQFDACNFAIDDVFIIVNQHYDGQMTICQVKSLSGEITDRYNIIIGPSQDWSTLTNSFCSSLGNDKNSFIQYYNNGTGASYWNATPESGRTYYLEVNGNEHSSDAERG